MTIDSAPAESVLIWSVSDGTCAEPGDPLGSAGDYVVLVTDESGEDPVTAACGALEHE